MRRLNLKNKKFNKSRLTENHMLIVIMAILISIQVFTSNKLATNGQQLSDLENKASVLEEENRKLMSSNIDNLSLRELADKAKKLGFVEPETIVNYSQSQSSGLALR